MWMCRHGFYSSVVIDRLAEIQEESLALRGGSYPHDPGNPREGPVKVRDALPAEASDAVMSERTEYVILNIGDFVLQG
jgi:hypothetical protein